MKKQTVTLAGVPAVLYGERSRRAYLYLHGKNGCKEEAERFAATDCEAGWQVLAIDLPEPCWSLRWWIWKLSSRI